MGNWPAADALIRLTHYQLFRGRSRLIVAFALSVVPAGVQLLSAFLQHQPQMRVASTALEQYYVLFAGLVLGLILPVVSLYCGTVLVGEEIEARTLLYLWTRPVSRSQILGIKSVVTYIWLLLFLYVSIVLTYLVCVLTVEPKTLIREWQILVWDFRAVALGALAYFLLGLLLSCRTKKPFNYGVGYIFLVDAPLLVLPDTFKLFSLRYYMFILTSNANSVRGGVFGFLNETPLSDEKAILTLVGVIILLGGSALWTFLTREYAAMEGVNQQ